MDQSVSGIRELSDDELDRVSGAWGPAGAGVGALTGAAGYLGRAATSGSFSWGGLAGATTTGAVLGGIGGPVGAVRAYFLPRAAFGMGAIGGASSSWGI